MTVIDWLATREWSSGSVGMYGTSYSGFNSIQLAMERPPALKAIIPIFATDDRFGDDVHYFGGALKALDLVDYPTYMVAMNALPPVPSIYGDGWREEWERRVLETEPWLLTWRAHQRLDDYWKFGSLRFDIDAIECPTMIIAGWADGYRNNTFRTFEALTCPKRMIIGPWSHASTDTCLPGPNHDLIPEHLQVVGPLAEGHRQRRRVRAADRGLRATLDAARARPRRGARRVAVRTDLARRAPEPHAAGPGEGARPNRDGDGPDRLDVRGDVGWTAWISCAGAMPWGQSSDQRPDEIHSLTYTWEPLEDELEIMGQARLSVRVTSSAPVAYLSAKLCDVFPDGTSSLVTRGMLNLTLPRFARAADAARARHHVRHRARARGDVVGLRGRSPHPAGPGRAAIGRTRGRPPNR